MKVTFPSLENYNLKKAGEMALYHAHSDLYPFKSVIDTIENGLSVYHQTYYEMADKARDNDDVFAEYDFMYSGQIYGARVMPLAYYSLVLTLVSILEEAFNTICRAYQLMNKYNITYKDFSGQGIERAILYLEKVAYVKGIKNDDKWEFIKTMRDARNMIVHNGGHIHKSDTPKFTKHGFYISEENNKLMFMYKDIMKMYDTTVGFIDRVFKIEPEIEALDRKG